MTIKRNFALTALVAVGLVASLEYASIAQLPSPTPSPTTTPSPTPSPTTTPTNSGVRSSLSEFDRQFMVEAAQGGMAEVELGTLARQKASSNVVKEYARRMIVEHTEANNRLKALAQQKGVTLPTTIGEKNQDLKQDLSELTGAKFDREYMKEAGVDSHEEQAKLFERQVQRGQDPDVKSFAAQTLPVVQKHLQHAQEITGSRSNSSKRSFVPAK
jgi:putative membrane protein